MNKSKRLFVAINLKDKIKNELFSVSNNYPEIPARWIKKENLHITLFFLGFFPEERIKNLKNAIKKACDNIKKFEIEIEEISYFPKKPKTPKMIWAKINHSKNLLVLRDSIKKEVKKNKNENFSLKEKNDFKPHINLAKINQWKFNQLNLDEIPIIEKKFELKIDVNSIELMESHLKKDGAKYFTIEKFNIQN